MNILQEYKQFRSRMSNEYGESGWNACENLVSTMSDMVIVRVSRGFAQLLPDPSAPTRATLEQANENIRKKAADLLDLAEKAGVDTPAFIRQLNDDPSHACASELVFSIIRGAHA